TVSGGGETVTTNDTASDLTTIVDPPDFALTVSPGTVSLLAGQSTTYTVTVNSLNGAFGSPVALTLNGLPNLTSAAFSSVSVTPGSNGATSSLTVVTLPGDPYVAWNSQGKGIGLFAFAFPAIALVFSGFLPRGRKKRVFLTLVLFSLFLAGSGFLISGCASSANFRKLGTAPGSYTLTVTGSSGATQHS